MNVSHLRELTTMRYYTIISSLLFLVIGTMGGALSAKAQDGPHRLQGIKATTPHVAQKQGKKVAVDFTVDLSEMPALNRNVMLEVTPVLEANNSAQRVELPSFIISGRTRAIMLTRKGRTADVVKTRTKGQTYHYTSEAPFEQWLKDAALTLYAKAYGCADCDLGDEVLKLTPNALVPLYQPKYTYNMMVPQGEETKRREESITALIVFNVAKSDFVPTLGNNKAELKRVEDKLKELTTNNNLKVDGLKLTGYASPEGGAEFNQTLSEKRVESISRQLVNRYPRFKNSYKSVAMGADWDGLRDAVAKSSMADKESVLKIIDERPVAERTPALQQLNGGNTYAYLLREVYPPLRRTVITFSFIVRGFELEEAREVIKTHPTHLSLAEINLVAKSYPEDSNEQYQTWVTAAKAFPTAVEPATNAAIMDFKAGRYAQAVRLLEQFKENKKLWNILGVAYAYNEQYEEAKSYLEKAAQSGSAEAQHNLDELNHFLADNF